MIEIKEFYTKLHHINATDTCVKDEGIFKSQQELERPSPIIFKSSYGEDIEIILPNYGGLPNTKSQNLQVYSKSLEMYYELQNIKEFKVEDLKLLSEVFNFKLEDVEFLGSKKLTSSLSHLNSLYDACGHIVFLESDTISYILIYFKRWSLPIQPRGAAEDQYGEDITYIHGIWENPKLPQTILTKIKS